MKTFFCSLLLAALGSMAAVAQTVVPPITVTVYSSTSVSCTFTPTNFSYDTELSPLNTTVEVTKQTDPCSALLSKGAVAATSFVSLQIVVPIPATTSTPAFTKTFLLYPLLVSSVSTDLTVSMTTGMPVENVVFQGPHLLLCEGTNATCPSPTTP